MLKLLDNIHDEESMWRRAGKSTISCLSCSLTILEAILLIASVISFQSVVENKKPLQ